MTSDACPACGASVAATDRYCEACGQDLNASLPERGPSRADSVVRWVSSSVPPLKCSGCGGARFGAEGYCDGCGQRRPAGEDHTELDLGVIAAVSDRGLRHHNNEDAVALIRAPRTLVAVVCDGVSSSTRPDTASHAAVDAAAAILSAALGREESAEEAISQATRAAQAAAALVAGPDPGDNPPSSTFVCAVVGADSVTVGWVGDSRAYWIPDTAGDAARLTVDDSLAGQLAAAGRPVPANVPKARAGALLRWLGADAPEASPHLYTFRPSGPGRVLVCSDGLFRYRPEAAELAASTPDRAALATAQALVRLALDAGGQDNVTVAVLPFPPAPHSERPS